MKLFKNISVLLLIAASSAVFAQSNNTEIKISGKVTDFNDRPIKNAVIYVDSVRTEVTTNRRGNYKIKLSSKVQHIGTSVEQFGLLSTNFTGERRIDFVFRNPEDQTGGNDVKIGMIYKKNISATNNNIRNGADYETFSSVLEILDKRFPFVKFGNQGTIRIGNGPSSGYGDQTPLIIIDEQRSNVGALLVLPTHDIAKIRVIRRGSEASTYGGLGSANGVIIVKTKGGS